MDLLSQAMDFVNEAANAASLLSWSDVWPLLQQCAKAGVISLPDGVAIE